MLEFRSMIEPVSDADLNAYLDAALDAAARARIDAELERDASLRARLESLRRVDSLLRDAFPSMGSAPRFDDLVNTHFDAQRVVALASRRQAWRAPAAAAATVAIAALGGYWFGAVSNQVGSQFVSIEPGATLYAALEYTPSGESVRADGDVVEPILTFRASDGRFCREVEFDHGDAASVGIACRGEDSWRMVVLAETEGAPDPSGYATVGDDAAAAIENAFNHLGSSEPLSPEAEQALISAGWRAARD